MVAFAAMPFDNVLFDAVAPVATVTVNRPKVLNALDGATLGELAELFARIARTPAIRCVIVTGAGEKAFAAGADIAALAEMGPLEARALAALGHRLAAEMAGLHAPIIGAINGFALGGGLELALACDFAIASETARLGMPEVSLGVIPGFGGTQQLARRVGPARAKELIFTGELIGAAEARDLGLVNSITPPADLMPRVRAIATKIASRGPLAVAAAKRALRMGEDQPLERAVALEQELFGAMFASADQREGMRAFLAKRPPVFQGK